ncbi:MAG: hypothetical protein ACI35Q_10875 [Marinilabiliaceae bacterium]
MVKGIITLLIVWTLAASAARAQTFEGVVCATDGGPVPGASVILLNSQKRPVTFARTDADGAYAIKIPEGKEGKWLAFIALGFVRDTIAVASLANGSRHTLREKVTEIREVKVQAGRIFQRGDTLNFQTALFKQSQDRSIEDVLKKIPGIQVKSNGSIEWQGKPINKFYIEGMDLLGDKYAQASQNISADKVQKVQVIENHEPVKLLRDVSFSDQAALNIVLTEDAKNIWQGSARIGVGSSIESNPSALGDARLMAMIFAHKMQSISMYKFNNTGDDVLHEVSAEDMMGTPIPTERGVLSNISLGTPSLKEKRTRFNNSHVVATNWLFKLTDDHELRLQASGAHDKSRQQQRTETFYNDIDGGVTITEDEEAHSYETTVDTELKYQVNSASNYLTNTVKGLLDNSRSDGTSVLNGSEVDENVKPRRRYITENLEWTHRFESGRAVSLNGYASYNYLPGRLLLQDDESERLTFHSTFWGASTYYRHRAGRVYITYTLDTKGRQQRMDCDNTLAVSRDKYTQAKTRLMATVNYKSKSWDIEAELPFAWLARTFNGARRDDGQFEPWVRVKLTPDALWTFSTSYHYSKSPAQLTEVSASPVFTGYVTMRRGLGNIHTSRMHSSSAGVYYKNVPKGLFGRVSYYFSRRPDNILYAAEYTDGFYTSQATERKAAAVDHIISGNFTKSLSWWRTNISVKGDYSKDDYSLLIAEEVVPFSIRSGSAAFILSIQPQKWLSVDFKSSYDAMKQHNRQNHAEDGNTLSSFTHDLKIFVMPGNWQMKWTHELYHSKDEGIATCYFSDMSVSYRQKKYEVSVELSNMFGVSEYRQRFVTSTQRVFQSNEIRPREIIAKVTFDF